LPTEIARDELGAVADAEERNPRVVYRGIDPGRARHVDRRRATRKDDRLRVAGEHLRDRHRTRNDLAVYVDLAYPPGDQLRVLRGSVGWKVAMPQWYPRPGDSYAVASGGPIITESAPHAIALAMSPPVDIPPSAMTCTYTPVSSR